MDHLNKPRPSYSFFFEVNSRSSAISFKERSKQSSVQVYYIRKQKESKGTGAEINIKN